MPHYAIGDVQGCFDPLQRLLEKIQFEPHTDCLWFAGDIVNRGPDSLSVLRFIANLKNVVMVLGNHDLHLLAVAAQNTPIKKHDTLTAILKTTDRDELCAWLRRQPLLYYEHDFLLVHAGLPPEWDLQLAIQSAKEVENILQSDHSADFLKRMYGDKPKRWSNDLMGLERLRYITNALTRIRFCNLDGELNFSEKGDLEKKPAGFLPWFQIPHRKNKDLKIIFGHWAALYNQWSEVIKIPNIYPLDSGCVWGNCLTALRLEDGARFSVPC